MIELAKVYKTYHENTPREMQAVKSATLSIRKPGLYLLKGPSGSGKSTLLSLIGALNKPTGGEMVVLGENVAKLPDHFASAFRREKLGFIFQQFHLLPQMSALENVILPLAPSNVPFSKAAQQGQAALEKLGIGAKADVPARLLSGGEQQRVAIARALINDPQLILADEPTANLDAVNKQILLAILQRLKNEGKTLLIATHDPLFDTLEAEGVFEMREGSVGA
ncbi:MAG: ABC transporter ATP-binding protein [Campylobacterales bacterium]